MVALPFCHVQLTAPKPLSPAYPTDLKTLGDRLRKRRLDLGMLQKEVADRLGVNVMTICNWETNRTSPQVRFIPRIIAFLGYDPYDVPPEGLGKRIVTTRRRLGLSRKRLAAVLDIDPGTKVVGRQAKARPGRAHRGDSTPF